MATFEDLTNDPVIKRDPTAEEKKLQMDELLGKLMGDINELLREEEKQMPRWRKEYRDEDPRSVYYHKMLKRLGLSEKHARFAPWFYKSQKHRLSRHSTLLFEHFEEEYIQAQIGITEGERALASYKAFADRLREHKDIEPRQINQVMIRRAFRDCSFVAPEVDLDRQKNREKIHPALREHDPETSIPLVTYKNTAPGLAPPVIGQIESHGHHIFFTYSGRWKNGHMRGPMGTYSFADGGKYTGGWKDSLQCGSGVAEYPNGSRYTGHWKDGKYHGYGEMEYANRTKYEGQWKDGLRHGKGKITYPSGAFYDGDFFMGYKEGTGVGVSASGHKYAGDWRHNRIHGYGIVTLKKGKRISRDKWGPYVLGEAIAQAKIINEQELLEERDEMRKLTKVRDDLRALDLQLAYRERKRLEDEEEERKRKAKLKQERKEKKEAQEAAKQAFLTEMLEGGNIDDMDSSSDDSDDSESGSDDSES